MTHLHDSLFIWHEASINANGDRADHCPESVIWEANLRQEHEEYPLTWFTDGQRLAGPCASRLNTRIVWLLEPRALHPENYEYIEHMLTQPERIDFVFTHDAALLARSDIRIQPYPHGGTRIAASNWRMYKKAQTVSIIASSKRSLPGHVARHELISAMRDDPNLHAFGPEYQPLRRKLYALRDYRYHVVIENVNDGVWFTEALLDAFLTGCVPLYYGDPRRVCDQWGFDEDGIPWLPYSASIEDLSSLVQRAIRGDFDTPTVRTAMLHNFARAHEYVCAEDWLQRNYPELFNEAP